MRLAITSDLHFDPDGYLTPPVAVEALAVRVMADRPDAIVLAGDLAHGLGPFSECIACFRQPRIPVAVLAGNHDVWRDEETGTGSEALFFGGVLEQAVRRQGALWLERDVLRVGEVAVVGSMAWYDYSAIDPGLRMSVERIAGLKRLYNNDALHIDWGRTDAEVATHLGQALVERLERACGEATVRAVAVVTHVPLLEAQMVRRPGDPQWGLSNAYFGNLTLGERVLGFSKVRAIASGHTHCGRKAVVQRPNGAPVEAYVVPSEYQHPRHILLEV